MGGEGRGPRLVGEGRVRGVPTLGVEFLLEELGWPVHSAAA